MSSSGDGDDGSGRRIQNMQDLFRYCVMGTVAEDTTVGTPEMDAERKAWLENALKSMSVDVVQEMLEAIANIRREFAILSNLEGGCGDINRDKEDSAIESIVSSLDYLKDRTEDLDLATDFEKIGGFHILGPLLESTYPELQAKASELVAEVVQNHDYCQKAALEFGLLNTLVKILDMQNEKVKVKALYAVSCLIRSNKEAQDTFANKLDGFSVLLRVMQSISPEEGPKLRTKSAFLLTSIIRDRQDFKDVLLKMGFVDQLVGLLHLEHDHSHEHLLSSLLHFISDFPPALAESARPQLQLKQVLQNRISLVSGQPEYLEEESYCKNILELLQSSGDIDEGGLENSNSTDR